ncbi:MAG: hypothetical protein HY706_22055 [Candidatus Hydrogenedentes bacterium]|nr:hypothetical protein [Candidatus Hydrogenedentota bacterium]
MRRVATCIAGLAVLTVVGCIRDLPVTLPGISSSEKSDEEQIAAVLDDVQRGMQTRRIYKVIAYVSRNYHDADGRDFAAVQAYLSSIFKKYRSIKIERVPPTVAVQGNRARAVETFGTNAQPEDATVDPPIHLQGQVAVYFEKAGGAWQIVEWGNVQ